MGFNRFSQNAKKSETVFANNTITIIYFVEKMQKMLVNNLE